MNEPVSANTRAAGAAAASQAERNTTDDIQTGYHQRDQRCKQQQKQSRQELKDCMLANNRNY